MSDVMHDATDEELAAAAHAGDEAAFTVLYHRYARQVYGFLAVRLPAGARADAEALAADTLSEAWLSLRGTVPGNFSGWIHAIARNVLAAYLESWGMRPGDGGAGADGTGDAAPGSPAEAGAGRAGTRKRRARPALVPVEAMADTGDPAVWLTFREAEQRADWPAFMALLRDSISSLPQPYRPVLRASLEEFLAARPPAGGEGLAGQGLARQVGITPQQADRLRSDGLDRLYGAFTVTAMARGYGGTEPCPRFRRLAGSGREEGPLGERLRDRLVRHVPQCALCTTARKRLHTTMEFFPVLIPALIPAGLLAREHPPAQPEAAPATGGGAPRPASPRPGRLTDSPAGGNPQAGGNPLAGGSPVAGGSPLAGGNPLVGGSAAAAGAGGTGGEHEAAGAAAVRTSREATRPRVGGTGTAGAGTAAREAGNAALAGIRHAAHAAWTRLTAVIGERAMASPLTRSLALWSQDNPATLGGAAAAVTVLGITAGLLAPRLHPGTGPQHVTDTPVATSSSGPSLPGPEGTPSGRPASVPSRLSGSTSSPGAAVHATASPTPDPTPTQASSTPTGTPTPSQSSTPTSVSSTSPSSSPGSCQGSPASCLITVDLTGLGYGSFALGGLPWMDASKPEHLRLVPGSYYLLLPYDPGTPLYFQVTTGGLIAYDGKYDGILAGAGTATLGAVPRSVTVDLTGLRYGSFGIGGLPWMDASKPEHLRLVPGSYYLLLPYAPGTPLYFQVTTGGLITYDGKYDGILAGAGTATLGAVPRSVTVDLTGLPYGSFGIGGLGPWLDGTKPEHLSLVPGSYYMLLPTAPTTPLYFQVTTSGLFAYDATYDGTFTGAGTATLGLTH